MNFNMNFPSFKGCKVIQVEEREGSVIVHVEMKRKTHQCPRRGRKTTQIYDYRYQKIKHLKWFERNTEIFYKT